MARVGGLETGARQCLVDVARDRAGLVDLKAVVDRPATLEGMQRRIAFRDVGRERIDRDPMVLSLFLECETGDPAVNAVLVTV